MTMNIWTKKVAGATVLGALLAGAGMGVAVAAAPTGSTAADPTAYDTSEVTNLTPYTWTLLPNSTNTYDAAPPQTVAPGQTAVWAAHDISYNHWETLNYAFTDSTGGAHTVSVEDASDGYTSDRHVVLSYSRDGSGANAPVSTASFHMAWDPDGYSRHVDADWNTPTAITIDATKDPADAEAIVRSELPQIPVDQVTWAPLSKTPTFTEVSKQQFSSTLVNYSSAPAELTVSHDTTVGESTSIGVETSASLSTEVFGVVSTVTARVTGEHAWETSDSVNIDQDTEISPDYAGYLLEDNSIATVVGTLTFTTPQGTTFTVENVAVSRGDIAPNASGTGMNVSATQAKVAPLDATPTAK